MAFQGRPCSATSAKACASASPHGWLSLAKRLSAEDALDGLPDRLVEAGRVSGKISAGELCGKVRLMADTRRWEELGAEVRRGVAPCASGGRDTSTCRVVLRGY